MRYVDPHKRRAEFHAAAFNAAADGASRWLVFTERDSERTLTLRKRDASLTAALSTPTQQFVLRKVQLLDSPRWLILGFAPNAVLSRLVVLTAELGHPELDAALKALTCVPYVRRVGHETPNPALQRTGSAGGVSSESNA